MNINRLGAMTLAILSLILMVASVSPLALRVVERNNQIKIKQYAADSEYYAVMHRKTANVIGLYIGGEQSVCVTVVPVKGSSSVVVRQSVSILR